MPEWKTTNEVSEIATRLAELIVGVGNVWTVAVGLDETKGDFINIDITRSEKELKDEVKQILLQEPYRTMRVQGQIRFRHLDGPPKTANASRRRDRQGVL